MDGDNLEGIELKPGESAAQALAKFEEGDVGARCFR
jgi:hypothetical protein